MSPRPDYIESAEKASWGTQMTIHQLHPNGLPTPTDWPALLHTAFTEAEVVDVARDFMAAIWPYEIARMPHVCRPPRIKHANDITEFAFALARHHCGDGEGAEHTVQKMRVFFAEATHRLSQILHCRSEQPDSRQSA